jgi:hypothetical protein
MARTSASVAASRIRIEEEVWDEAFSARVPSRRARVPAADGAERPLAAVGAERPLRVASPTPVGVANAAPGRTASTVDSPAGGRRTVRIQGRGADPFRSHPSGRAARPVSPVPRTLGASPDRLAMWATLLGFVLVLVAILSSHF